MANSAWTLTGRVITSGRDLGRGWVLVEGRQIVAVGTGARPAASVGVDVGEMLVVPGFVDLHVHGGGGHQVSGDDPAAVTRNALAVAAYHVRHGTTAMLAATVSDTPERLLAAVTGVAAAAASGGGGGASILGTHLEGPWLSPAHAGAHAPACLRRPDVAEMGRLLAASAATLRLVTFAPELDGADEILAAGVAAGVVMSVGHTDADYEVVRAAFDAGARHMTHFGNAMAALDRRSPGPMAAALADGRATLEVIADGFHVHSGLLDMLGRLVPGRLVAVTDATAACGMAAGRYRLGGSEIVVEEGRVALADRPNVLAGSALTMDRAIATLVGAGIDVATAVTAATATPAGVLGEGGKGNLRAGADADVVVLDERLSASAVIVGGRIIWDRNRRLAAVRDAARP